VPSKSKAQHNLMAMVAHDPKAAKRLGIPQSVGKEFTNADKGRKFREGGTMKDDSAYKAKERKHVAAMKKAGVPKKIVREEEQEAGMKKGGCCKMKKGGSIDGIAQRGKTRGKVC